MAISNETRSPQIFSLWVVHVDFVAHRGYVIEAEDEDQAVEIAETLNTRPSHSVGI